MDINSNKTAPSENSVFINGKAQAIEILRLLDPDEKKRLLHQMRLRNPEMTIELSEKSLSFANIMELSNHEIRIICNNIDPQIMGVALKATPINFQKRVLSIVERKYAERAYEGLIANLNNERESSAKAQNKIIQLAIQLKKYRQIELS